MYPMLIRTLFKDSSAAYKQGKIFLEDLILTGTQAKVVQNLIQMTSGLQ